MAKTRGRPEFEITQEVLDKVKRFAAQGLNNDQIARCLGVSSRTLYNKKDENEDLLKALNEGKAEGIEAVTNALYEKAIKGDNIAMIFFLKNRAPKDWADKPERPEEEEKATTKIEVSIIDHD